MSRPTLFALPPAVPSRGDGAGAAEARGPRPEPGQDADRGRRPAGVRLQPRAVPKTSWKRLADDDDGIDDIDGLDATLADDRPKCRGRHPCRRGHSHSLPSQEDSVATTDAVDDLIRALDGTPHRSDDLRSRILPPEILELPARVAKEIRDSNRQVMALSSRLAGLERAVSQPRAESAELLEPQLDSLSLSLDNLIRRLARYESDIGLFRSRHAREVVRERSGLLATELGYRKIRTLTTDDLCDFVDNADTHGSQTSCAAGVQIWLWKRSMPTSPAIWSSRFRSRSMPATHSAPFGTHACSIVGQSSASGRCRSSEG